MPIHLSMLGRYFGQTQTSSRYAGTPMITISAVMCNCSPTRNNIPSIDCWLIGLTVSSHVLKDGNQTVTETKQVCAGMSWSPPPPLF